MENKHLYSKWGEKLRNAELAPPPTAFKAVEAKLNSAAKQKKVYPYFWRGVVAASIVILTIFGYFLPKNTNDLLTTKTASTNLASISSKAKSEVDNKVATDVPATTKALPQVAQLPKVKPKSQETKRQKVNKPIITEKQKTETIEQVAEPQSNIALLPDLADLPDPEQITTPDEIEIEIRPSVALADTAPSADSVANNGLLKAIAGFTPHDAKMALNTIKQSQIGQMFLARNQ